MKPVQLSLWILVFAGCATTPRTTQTKPKPKPEPVTSAATRAPKVGDVVWAEWVASSWHAGQVDGECEGGFHIAFDDGDEACRAAPRIAHDAAPDPTQLESGMRVLVSVQVVGADEEDRHPGKLVESVGDERWTVRLDGGAKVGVGADKIQVTGDSIKLGDMVWAEWKRTAWYQGRIDEACEHGFHVLFDDGDQACRPAAQMTVDKAPDETKLSAGERVLALVPAEDGDNGLSAYPAILGSKEGGSWRVDFDDGNRAVVDVGNLRAFADR